MNEESKDDAREESVPRTKNRTREILMRVEAARRG